MYESANIATATDLYFSLEKNNPGDDIVLVRAETFGEIRSAYRNYFQDTEDFVRYVDNGISNIFQSDSKTNSPNDNVR
jgi:putative GTP pyrophosphokinase